MNINFSDSAAGRVKQLLKRRGSNSERLRVFITGGGCSGFQYCFDFDANLNEDDVVVTNDGVSLVVDALSYQYLLGATVDYEEGLLGAKFLVKNPIAKSTCGCGSSFSI